MAWWLVNGYSGRKWTLGLGIVDLECETDIENQKIVNVWLIDFKKCIKNVNEWYHFKNKIN